MAWEFVALPSGEWKWRRIGDDSNMVLEESEPFTSFVECVSDATKHGYLRAPSEPDTPGGPGGPPFDKTEAERDSC